MIEEERENGGEQEAAIPPHPPPPPPPPAYRRFRPLRHGSSSAPFYSLSPPRPTCLTNRRSRLKITRGREIFRVSPRKTQEEFSGAKFPACRKPTTCCLSHARTHNVAADARSFRYERASANGGGVALVMKGARLAVRRRGRAAPLKVGLFVHHASFSPRKTRTSRALKRRVTTLVYLIGGFSIIVCAEYLRT